MLNEESAHRCDHRWSRNLITHTLPNRQTKYFKESSFFKILKGKRNPREDTAELKSWVLRDESESTRVSRGEFPTLLLRLCVYYISPSFQLKVVHGATHPSMG